MVEQNQNKCLCPKMLPVLKVNVSKRNISHVVKLFYEFVTLRFIHVKKKKLKILVMQENIKVSKQNKNKGRSKTSS